MVRKKIGLFVSVMMMAVMMCGCGDKKDNGQTNAPATANEATADNAADSIDAATKDEAERDENIKGYYIIKDTELRTTDVSEYMKNHFKDVSELEDAGAVVYAYTNEAGELVIDKDLTGVENIEEKNDGTVIVTLKSGDVLLADYNDTTGELFVVMEDDTLAIQVPEESVADSGSENG